MKYVKAIDAPSPAVKLVTVLRIKNAIITCVKAELIESKCIMHSLSLKVTVF